MKENFDVGLILVIVITFILILLALFTKGFLHDLLLAAAVFIVFVKLVLMAYKNTQAKATLLKELQALKDHLKNAKK